jgi:hypothetical protein
MLSTFIIPLCTKAVKAQEREGLARIFSHWSQTSTSTGRLASSDPNLQNVPKHDSLRLVGRSDLTAEINVRDAFLSSNGLVLLAGTSRQLTCVSLAAAADLLGCQATTCSVSSA